MLKHRTGAMKMADRLPHAVLDLDSRRQKALKIERLLNLSSKTQPVRLLEIGTGSGGIAHYFATHQSLQFDVTAVDVIDQRMVADDFKFQIVKNTQLPFADRSFDVVLSNHVIEHVGDNNAQCHHLKEIHRVMNLEGVGYLAVPNRWMPVEPHYKLIFLSWLPRSLRSYYLRLMGKGASYDCEPLSLRELEQLLEQAGFEYQNLCTRAMRETMAIELHHGMFATAVGKFPDYILGWLSFANPTLIYRLKIM